MRLLSHGSIHVIRLPTVSPALRVAGQGTTFLGGKFPSVMVEKSAGTRCRGPRLGLLADGYDYEFQERLLAAAERAARDHGLDFVAVSGCLLGVEPRDPKRFVYDLIGPDCVDALLICTHVIGHQSTTAEVHDFVARFRDVPCVSIGVPLSGVGRAVVSCHAP